MALSRGAVQIAPGITWTPFGGGLYDDMHARCFCGHARYMHTPLMRSDGSREDCQDGTVGIGPRLGDGTHGPPKEKVKGSIDPCTYVGCTCGYFEKGR